MFKGEQAKTGPRCDNNESKMGHTQGAQHAAPPALSAAVAPVYLLAFTSYIVRVTAGMA